MAHSTGTAVVMDDCALLWTDGRYHLQATQELDENWTLMKLGVRGGLGLRGVVGSMVALSLCLCRKC